MISFFVRYTVVWEEAKKTRGFKDITKYKGWERIDYLVYLKLCFLFGRIAEKVASPTEVEKSSTRTKLHKITPILIQITWCLYIIR